MQLSLSFWFTATIFVYCKVYDRLRYVTDDVNDVTDNVNDILDDVDVYDDCEEVEECSVTGIVQQPFLIQSISYKRFSRCNIYVSTSTHALSIYTYINIQYIYFKTPCINNHFHVIIYAKNFWHKETAHFLFWWGVELSCRKIGILIFVCNF